MTVLVDVIAGARPNFVKIAPILHAMRERRDAGGPLNWRLVHTGQHYDPRMSGDFFEQLGIPSPDVNLEVGSGTQAEQTAGIMIGYERLLLERRVDKVAQQIDEVAALTQDPPTSNQSILGPMVARDRTRVYRHNEGLWLRNAGQ